MMIMQQWQLTTEAELKLNDEDEKEPPPHEANATAATTCNVNWGLADAGATGTFLLPGAPVINIRKAKTPLRIILPDGNYIYSTHQCNLNNSGLPPAMTEAHIVPGLAHTSLISIKQLCKHGAKVIYADLSCRVYVNKKLVWIGQQEPTTGLWVLPLQPNHPVDPAITQSTSKPLEHTKNSVPTLPTWIKAIDNGHFFTWPGLTSTAVHKHLEPSPATDKGNMKQLCQNVQSTRKKKEEEEQDMNPKLEEMEEQKAAHVFCFAAIADANTGTLYINNTGKIPV
ncbi:hypothetical protein ACHAXS_002437 [Conticribra weissflogii]